MNEMFSILWSFVELLWSVGMIVWLIIAAHHYDKVPSVEHFQTLAIVLLLLCWGTSGRKSA